MNWRDFKVTFVVVGLFALMAALAPALAAEEAAPSSTNWGAKILALQDGFGFGTVIQLGIILTSVFMFGWIIMCFVTVRRDKVVPPEVIGSLQNYIDEGDLEGALQYCEAAPNFLTRVVGHALNRMQFGAESVKEAAGAMIDTETGKLEYMISPIALTASVGPLMGLFGTVTGMVMAFDKIENAPGGQVNPKMVAGGIALALLSTVIGLIIAIPGLTAYWFFKNRVAAISGSISLVADDMVETISAYAGQEG